MLIADTILAEPGPYSGFKVWWGKIHFREKIFLSLSYVSKKNFSVHNKIWGAQIFGVTSPECPPYLRAWAEPSPGGHPLGAFVFVQGARHSENLYLIHNMDSICRLCKLH